MDVAGGVEFSYDRNIELKAFDETKAGVKGLVDARVTKIPRIFIHNPSTSIGNSSSEEHPFSVPIIDLTNICVKDKKLRANVIGKLRDACENWGFFQLINHGIPESVLNDMIDGVRRFHEQDTQVKKEFYSRDEMKVTLFNSNFDLYGAPAANWRDSVYCSMAPNPPNPEELPEICRDIMIDYTDRVMKLGQIVFELMSEALGLQPDYLKDMGCSEGIYFIGHYYPACPEPDLTLGISKHTDSAFLTIVLQDQLGGLQVLHQGHWVNVTPVPGALVANLGDMSQLITTGSKVCTTGYWQKKLVLESQLPVFLEPIFIEALLVEFMDQSRSCFQKKTLHYIEKPLLRTL